VNTEAYRARVAADIWVDCWHEAQAIYWRRRAEMLRWAQPREDDFHGASSLEERRARWRRLEEAARACEARASVAQLGGEEW